MLPLIVLPLKTPARNATALIKGVWVVRVHLHLCSVIVLKLALRVSSLSLLPGLWVLLTPRITLTLQERKFSPKRKFSAGHPCGHPAKNFGQALQILEKQALRNGHPTRTSMKKLRPEKLRADFSFPNTLEFYNCFGLTSPLKNSETGRIRFRRVRFQTAS